MATTPETFVIVGAGLAGAKAAEALQKRSAAAAQLEKACAARTGNQCSVIKLYSGERYDLYQYKKYPDLRLVNGYSPVESMIFTLSTHTSSFSII